MDVLSHDRKWHDERPAIAAIKQYKIGCFYLWGAQDPTWAKMHHFVRCVGKITNAALHAPRPFIFQVKANLSLVRVPIPTDGGAAGGRRGCSRVGSGKYYKLLHCYGYTARHDDIGVAVAAVAKNWTRFAIRSSAGRLPGLPAAFVSRRDVWPQGNGIICPVETDKTATCGTCALCWDQTAKPIVFLEH